jgi:hypothetical protein
MSTPSIGHAVEKVKRDLAHRSGLPFQQVLPQSQVEEWLKAKKVWFRRRIFPPVVTLWMFLSQVLEEDKTCENALTGFLAFQASQGLPLPSADPSAYSQARQRLPEGLIQSLVVQTASDLEAAVPSERLWKGRSVFLVDGSTFLMADTPENQAEYPQHGNQKPGCGFPIARIAGFFSLATGALCRLAVGNWKTHELTLVRPLYATVPQGALMVGDAIFGSYADVWLLRGCGIDGLFQIQGARKTDFRKGKKLGKDDHLVTWTKPKHRPQGLPQEVFDQLPPTLTVREFRYRLQRKGFCTEAFTLVTTLTDPNLYPKEELTALFGLRWDVELDLRHVKTTMGMEFLATKSPQMVRKELFTHLLAYNLIRTVMWQAGIQHEVDPLRLSFQSSIRYLLHFLAQLPGAGPTKRRYLISTCLSLIAEKKLPDRSGRHEPRVRKRRPKAFPLMQQPRPVLRKKLTA